MAGNGQENERVFCFEVFYEFFSFHAGGFEEFVRFVTRLVFLCCFLLAKLGKLAKIRYTGCLQFNFSWNIQEILIKYEAIPCLE